MRYKIIRKPLITPLFIVLASMLACSTYAGPNPIKVTVDPRIELLSAVQLLSSYAKTTRITRCSFQYKQEMSAYFSPYKHHRAVVLFDKMWVKFFAYDAPPTLMLYVSDPPYLTPHAGFQSAVRKIATQRTVGAEGEKSMIEFVDALRDFARVSKFEIFYNAHRDTYRAMIRNVEDEVGRVDIVGPVESCYGKSKQLKYIILLAPLFHAGGYGPMVEHANGVSELYNICGPIGVKKGLPTFGDSEHTRRIAWHEFGHSFANPLGDKYSSDLARYSSLYDPISRRMREQHYGQWKTCVNEHVVRAVEARIIYQVEGRKASEEFVEENRIIDGFAYIKPLCERLVDYENHRDKYPTLASFYPQLVQEFKSLHGRRLGRDFYSFGRGEWAWLWLKRLYRYGYLDTPVKILCIIIFPPIISAIWAYRDARKRGKRGLPVALLVLLGIWPIGLIVWLFVRRRSKVLK